MKLLIAPIVIIVLGALPGGALILATGILSKDFTGGVSNIENALSYGWIFSAVFWTLVVVMAVGAFVTLAGMVVNWHRFVLLEEYPGWWTSPFQSKQLVGYLKLAVVVFVITVAIFVGVGFVSGVLGAFLGSVGFVAVFFVLSLPAYVFITRMMMVLPSQAAGTGLAIGEAIAATKGRSWTILLALICIGIFNILLTLVEQGLTTVSGFLGVMTSLVFLPFNLLLFASLLTTLYGYFVEKRDLM